MVKRSIASLLWFWMLWTLGNMLSAFAGTPALLGPALGVLVAALVWWDPAGLLWSRSRFASPAMRRRLADLERVSDVPAGGELRRDTESAHG